eukprot:Cvel_31579.t1-p1 / transcript=Cvel_31579.t1 / gene=Cvel_31579 / organism=Chromera_velia_CCMP2878 / gene_product=hypothetical protein / transcript_product=hypothetical protein / location=Cvel_scaffold4731:6989-7913(+) / protein_length=283 / sequence_SO=supercontig / SO=protein_coding / is_pseudo=false
MPRVAVIGCGIAGAVAASELSKRGVEVTVFEMGRGPGGRSATRLQQDGRLFDHGAPFFAVSETETANGSEETASRMSKEFEHIVEDWVKDGVVALWQARHGTFKNGGFCPQEGNKVYCGVGGMHMLGRHLSSREGITFVPSCRVSKVDLLKEAHEGGEKEGTNPGGAKWKLWRWPFHLHRPPPANSASASAQPTSASIDQTKMESNGLKEALTAGHENLDSVLEDLGTFDGLLIADRLPLMTGTPGASFGFIAFSDPESLLLLVIARASPFVVHVAFAYACSI